MNFSVKSLSVCSPWPPFRGRLLTDFGFMYGQMYIFCSNPDTIDNAECAYWPSKYEFSALLVETSHKINYEFLTPTDKTGSKVAILTKTSFE